MGRAPCCDKANVKKGPWSPEEDAKLKEYIEKNGTGGNWIALPQKVGLRRCGKSCRLRWLNYLRPNIKHGEFSEEEDRIICSLFAGIGSRWSIIAAQLPGRTDNDIKNYWNTKLKKKLMGIPQKKPHQATSYNNPLSSSNLFPHTSPTPTPYEYPYNTSQIRASSSVHNEPIIPTFTTLITSNSSGFMSPFNGTNNSCSSSDGSQITKEMEPDYRLFNGDYQSNYFTNGVDEYNHKFLLSGYSSSSSEVAVASGCLSENPLDYSIEEIKQLISTNNMCNNLSFFVDEIKTEEKLMDY